jgi:hypothetical protein
MSVFTLYNCGTDYHRGSDDIVGQLFRETRSDCEINDGIGSVGEDGDGAHTAADGLLHENWRNKLAEKPKMGSAFAVDIDKNVAAGLFVIKKRQKEDSDLHVNMLGWSRGAVTCFKIANHMYRDRDFGLQDVPVRIFAIDPVPGGTSFNDHVRRDMRLTPNVKQTQIILAQHERRILFRPVLPSNVEHKPISRDGEVEWDTMPGNHSSIVEKKQGLKPAYRLVRHLAKEFLAQADGSGTQFSGVDDVLLPLEILENYSKIWRRWNMFEDTGAKHWYGRKFGTLKRTVQSMNMRKDTVMVLKPGRGLSGDDFFINIHHRQVFRRLYNAVYQEMQMHRPFADGGRAPTWQNILGCMQRDAPKTYTDLVYHFGDARGSLL